MGSVEHLIIANASSETANAYISIFWIALVAMLSPLLSALTKKKIPDVVILLLLGAIIGPNVLHLADTDNGVELIKELGLGILFLIAGYEVNTKAMHSRQGGFALGTWAVCFTLALLASANFFSEFRNGLDHIAVFAIAMSSTALGTILPMVRANGKTGTKLGDAIMVHGALGEVMPVFAMSILLSTHSKGFAVLILLGFLLIALITAILPRRAFAHIPGLGRTMAAGANQTTQTMLRLAMLILSTLMMFAAVFNLDVVLGAFAAGIILRSLTPEYAFEPFSERLDVLGFSFLIPLFFICSGMGIDLKSIAKSPVALILFVLALLILRGLPVFLAERFFDTGSGLQTLNEKVQLGLYAAAGLPMIVAVTEVALSHELITESAASLLVGGGALTILIFPLLASGLDAIFRNKDAVIEEKTTKDKITEKKRQRHQSSQLSTSSLPVISQGPDGRGIDPTKKPVES
ncbi:cation:proton antiporter [Rothia sp. P6271]|uniref:cation:proton antiporter n=1 Tax=unclassified Rothia (in: high G+C Gram-positive bacteria) TaxID=2689056 RepID=UPI003AD32CE3